MTEPRRAASNSLSATLLGVARQWLELLDRGIVKARRRARLTLVRGHSFVDTLTPHSSVLDLGAHRGEFSTELASRIGCACYAVEPIASLHAEIPARTNITTFCAAVARTAGTARLYLSDNPEGSSLDASLAGHGAAARPLEVTTLTLDDLVERLRPPISLAKLDIEGEELGVLLNATIETLGRIEQITVEFHDFLPSYPTDQIAEVRARLKQLDFHSVVLSQGARDHSDVLFYRPGTLALSVEQRVALFSLQHFLLPLRGLLESSRRKRIHRLRTRNQGTR